MANPDTFRTYLDSLRAKLRTGVAREQAHRAALERLLQDTGNVQAVNEPSRIECGAPDFIVLRASTPVGYVEAKDIDHSLDAAARTDQLKRYRESLNNLILTDYLEFRWYVEGEERGRARLGSVTGDGKIRSTREGVQEVSDLLGRFFAQEAPVLGTAKELAQRMAGLARLIRDLIEEAYKREDKEGRLHSQLAAFEETLIPDLKAEQFADMYAQTITYGLFAARVGAPAGQEFTRQQAAWNLPKTNPFLRGLFNDIAGPELAQEIAWAVDDLAHLLARADMSEVLRDFGNATKQEDPIVHFYETFLAHYNPRMRQRRGVYFTPEPVVSYIVKSIDHLLKTRFDRPMGLADENVMILDPACGTGTFLYSAIREIHDTVVRERGAAAWNGYVKEKLLPRIFGFELLMAPYAIAHMKLAVQLQDLGYDFQGDERVGIYLTNTLEPALRDVDERQLPFAGFIREEARLAEGVKRDKPIMVVLGNPPYSVSSANKGDHIRRLMERYKEAVRKERQIAPLSDDYIKFIRFAQDRIERTGYGIVGMITNHSYLSGLIHRGMRKELMATFGEIYVIDLHGSTKLQARPPSEEADDNVFDIQQGVAIGLFVRPDPTTYENRVLHAQLWGPRKSKESYLAANDVSTTDWVTLFPAAPYHFFVPKDFRLSQEYLAAPSLKDIARVRVSGVQTKRDKFVLDVDEQLLRDRIAVFKGTDSSDTDLTERYGLKDIAEWTVRGARLALRQDPLWRERFIAYLYRPFDTRCLFYSDDLVARRRFSVMRHMLKENIALVTVRQLAGNAFCHAFVTSSPGDGNAISPSSREYNCFFPLYLYSDAGGRQGSLLDTVATEREPNLSADFLQEISASLVLDFIPDGKGDLESTFGPEDIFQYMYAIFHSPTYRERYAEFLKIDFPRLPLTSDLGLFRALAEKGEELVALHLMESPELDHLITRFMGKGDDRVEKVRYAEAGRAYMNKTQYFEGVEPQVWEFHIGGYQVLEKWLKDRKGRTLSYDDVTHYGKIVVALRETMRLMEEIDEVIPSWPIE